MYQLSRSLEMAALSVTPPSPQRCCLPNFRIRLQTWANPRSSVKHVQTHLVLDPHRLAGPCVDVVADVQPLSPIGAAVQGGSSVRSVTRVITAGARPRLRVVAYSELQQQGLEQRLAGTLRSAVELCKSRKCRKRNGNRSGQSFVRSVTHDKIGSTYAESCSSVA